MPEMTYAEAIRDAITFEMERDEKVFLLGEDIGRYGGAFGVYYEMLDKFGPERVRETPISEATIVGAATGAALMGHKPIAEIMFMDFTTLAMDNLVNQAAKIRFMFGGKATVPLVVRMPSGSGTGAAAQHSQSLETWLMHVPGLKVVIPSTPADAKGLMFTAMRDPNPVVFIEHKLCYKMKGEVPAGEYTIPFGKADIKRAGKDVTVVTSQIMLHRSLEAAVELEKEGFDPEIIDMRTLNPIDYETIISSVEKTGRLLVIHEACKTGGWAGEIIAAVTGSRAFDYMDAPARRLAGEDMPIPYNRFLERAAVPQVENIIEEIRSLAQGVY
ncbi:MAG: alpha-ketoacid dehydrogenase subunit beta [Anaerolineaceae bacterium]|nr:alpha-ketoacid dehydrogenase subunit beta [Anaerolineaceae bacterium]